jgi:transcriptional regulator with PAS, ATPase and Fis domain
VGESKVRQVNVRFIAATNRNLERESEAGNFRSDLFYRLSVFTISLPPLRERKDDIKKLAEYFINHFSIKTNTSAPAMSPAFLKSLQEHPWKGNIRELKNVMERCVILNDQPVLDADILPYDFNLHDDALTTGSMDLASAEKKHIQKVLAYTKGNKTQTAKLLGIGLTTLYQKIKDYNLS